MQDVSGGASRFAAFIGKELVPLVDGRFRTKPGDRTIVGHSYGGLFGAWVLLQRPQLFSRAVLVSPSLWYADRFVFGVEKERRAANRGLATRLFLAAGSLEDGAGRHMVGDLRTFARQLDEAKYTSLRVRTQVFEGETHDSIFPVGVTRGLREVFDPR